MIGLHIRSSRLIIIVVIIIVKKWFFINGFKIFSSRFGEINSPYDFVNNSPNECKKMLQQLQEKHNSIRKKINTKVMNMIDGYVIFFSVKKNINI